MPSSSAISQVAGGALIGSAVLGGPGAVLAIGAVILIAALTYNPAQSVNQVTSFNSFLSQIIDSNIQECLNSVNLSQSISIQCNVDPVVAAAFLNSAGCITCQANINPGATLSTCDSVCRACVVSNVNQQATFQISNSCLTDSTVIAGIQTSIYAAIDQAFNSQEPIVTSLLGTLPGLKSLATNNPDQVNSVNLVNDVKSLITQSNLQQLVNDMNTAQNIIVVGNGGTSVSGVNQSLVFYSCSSLVATSLQQAGLTNDLAFTLTQANGSANPVKNALPQNNNTALSMDDITLYAMAGICGLALIIFISWAIRRGILDRREAKRLQDNPPPPRRQQQQPQFMPMYY